MRSINFVKEESWRGLLGSFGALIALTFALALTLALMPAGVVPPPADTLVAPAAGDAANTGQNLKVESIVVVPANPIPDQPVSITVVVRNIGTATVTETFGLFLYVDPADQPPLTTTTPTNFTIYGLGLGSNNTFSYSYIGHTFNSTGTHVVHAWVDRANLVPEDDEADNHLNVSVPVGAVADVPDPYEQAPGDNACANATPIATDGAPQQHNLTPAGDEDWLKFYGQAGIPYTITLSNSGTNADALLGLLPTCNSPGSFGGLRVLRTPPLLNSGTFYIKVVNNNGNASSQTGYSISVSDGVNCSGFFEPNDARETSTEIQANGIAQSHRFCTPADEDWVKFSAQPGLTYSVQTSNLANGVLPVLHAYDAANTFVVSGSNAIQFAAGSPSIYYIRATNAVSTSASQSHTYSLTVSAQACAGDGYEPDNTRSESRGIVINVVPQRHTFCPAGDVDWSKFIATAGLTYTIETLSVGKHADTVICLRDNLGNPVACDDDSGFNNGSRIVWKANISAEFYIETRHALTNTTSAAGEDTAYDISVVNGLCLPDLSEPDNGPADSSVLTPDGSRQFHTFCTNSTTGDALDRDWVRLMIPAAGPYTLRTANLGPGADTVLSVYERNGSTRLASNDDYAAGLSSQLVYTFPASDTFYVEVRGFNPTRYGGSTSYALSAQPGLPPPAPQPGNPDPGPAPGPPPSPQPSGVQTLILVNRARMADVYGAARADAVIAKVNTLITHPAVQGEVVDLGANPTIAEAYAPWLTDATNTDKANQVANAIRNAALSYLNARTSVQYVLLVGDDRVIPMRRVLDRTSGLGNETQYTSIVPTTTVGSAIRSGYFLSDDYFVDKQPSIFEGQEVYVPDWGIGRLIETPEQISNSIDAFITTSQMTATRTLVTGWHFVSDVATNVCGLIANDIGSVNMDCVLIGENWDGNQARGKQLNTTPPYKLQAINGHASHVSLDTPNNVPVRARDVVSGTSDLSGSLIFAIGCHTGLNLSETSNLSLDLPEAYATKTANYIGNTGFGLGDLIGTRLSERVTQNFTQELMRDRFNTVGRAWMRAKQRYYAETDGFGVQDEKVMQQWVLYGFPMFRVNTGAAFDPPPFPSAQIDTQLPNNIVGALGSNEPTMQKGAINISITPRARAAANAPYAAGLAGFQVVTSSWGNYFTLDGNIATDSNGPLQPQLYVDVPSRPNQRLRGVLLTGGTFVTTTVDPVIATTMNEYIPINSEPAFESSGFYPPVLFKVQPNDALSSTTATLAMVLGQYNSANHEQRLFTSLRYEAYFSSDASGNTAGPTLESVDGFYNLATSRAHFKVEASDAQTVTRVLIRAIVSGSNQISTFDLSFNAATHKWTGEVPRIRGASYEVQLLDGAGNASTVTRKGGSLNLVEVHLPDAGTTTFLPVVTK